jgi:hypothetical protein
MVRITVETNSRDCLQCTAFTSIDRCFVLMQIRFIRVSCLLKESKYLSARCVLST